MAKLGSVTYQVVQLIKELNGQGESKKESRENSGITSAENGHKLSGKVHSSKSLTNLKNDIINLAKFAQKEHAIKDISKIDASVAKEWLKSKDIKYDTASNYISQLNKVSEYMSFNRNEMKEIRADFRQELPKSQKETRAYNNLEKVRVHERSQPAFELQRDYGLRPGAATNINVTRDLVKQGNSYYLTHHDKGHSRADWQTKEISENLANKIQEQAKDGYYKVPRSTYNRDLQKGFKEAGIKEWNGAHGIRHSFAQNQLESGKNKAEVSEAMGHVREEITNTYLR